ncbi:MAG: hypothetical protein NXI28_12440 [bacterium]|nr:hypothetical protein [bacterium]
MARSCCIYVPNNFDAETILPVPLRQYADCARYFLHRIIWGRVTKNRTLDDFVPLKFDYLRQVIPDRVVKPLKMALIGDGVIECDGVYDEKRKALGYKLCLQYRKAGILRVPLTNKATIERVRASRRAENKKLRLDVHRHLRKQIRRLEVDINRATALISDDPNYEIIKIPVHQIAAREVSVSVCRFGRVHTDLTRCTKKVRSALHVKGHSLVEIDIANSQPLFLALLLINYRRQGNKAFGVLTFEKAKVNPYRNIDQIVQETVTTFGHKKELTVTTDTLPSYTTRNASQIEAEHQHQTALTTTAESPQRDSVNSDFLSVDEQRFVMLCEQGNLYEEFMERAEFPVRPWVKEQFFEVIYGRNSMQSPVKADFEELFPRVAEVVRVHKRKDYRFLPRLMQNIEANFMINRVCRRIMNESPDAPLFTIHDSVLTTPEFANRFVAIMKQEFSKLGMSPTLRVTDYGSTSRRNASSQKK